MWFAYEVRLFKYVLIVFSVNKIKMLVVTDAFRNIQIRGFKQMVVDDRTGIRDISRDVKRGRLDTKQIASLVLLLGRVEAMEGVCVVFALEELKQALEAREFAGKVTVSGPLPIATESREQCEIFANIRDKVFNWAKNVPSFAYAHVGEVITDRRGVIRQLLSH